MPTYDYHCCECKHTFETFQKITDPALTTCPLCKKETLKRGIGGGSVMFRFQGSGYYETDYKREKPPSNPCACKGGKGTCTPSEKD